MLPNQVYANAKTLPTDCPPPFACALDMESNQTSYSADKLKSAGRAVLYGVGFTVVPSLISAMVDNEVLTGVLFIGGITMGPGAGLLYANDIDRALKGYYLRWASTAVTLAGGVVIALETIGHDNNSILGKTMMIGGLSVLTVSAIYDIFRAGPQAVKTYNEQNNQSSFSLSPWVSPQGTGGGLQFGINF